MKSHGIKVNDMRRMHHDISINDVFYEAAKNKKLLRV